MVNDPWTVLQPTPTPDNLLNNCDVQETSTFEDNFQPTSSSSSTPSIEEGNQNSGATADPVRLPDSLEYLDTLERKLQKLKSGSDFLQQLSARREHCLESLLRGSISLQTDADLGLENFSSAEEESSRAHQLIRHIIPERAIHPIELAHIIDYDQLQSGDIAEPTAVVEDPELKEQSGSVSR